MAENAYEPPSSMLQAHLEEYIKPRRPWLAGLLALGCPGLGHLYLGKPGVAAAFGLALPAGFAVTLGAAAWTDALGFLLFVCALGSYVVVYLAQVAWAVLAARRASATYRLRLFNRVPAYVGFFLICALASNLVSAAAKQHAFEMFRIPSSSMVPSLQTGDHVCVSKSGLRKKALQRGEMVTFRKPGSAEIHLKRVAGLPGDEIAIRGGVLQINGQPVERSGLGKQTFADLLGGSGPWVREEVAVFEESLAGRRHLTAERSEYPQQDFGPERVPAGHYFMLGDFRDNSQDSRHYGAVPAEDVLGRALFVWLSVGPDGIRYERLGMRL